MKLLVRFGNGPVRSLNKLVGAILLAVALTGLFFITDWAIDQEIAYHDSIVDEYRK